MPPQVPKCGQKSIQFYEFKINTSARSRYRHVNGIQYQIRYCGRERYTYMSTTVLYTF
jgi:hypothetical protein